MEDKGKQIPSMKLNLVSRKKSYVPLLWLIDALFLGIRNAKNEIEKERREETRKGRQLECRVGVMRVGVGVKKKWKKKKKTNGMKLSCKSSSSSKTVTGGTNKKGIKKPQKDTQRSHFNTAVTKNITARQNPGTYEVSLS